MSLAALALSLWTHPGSAPCATEAGNHCWTGPIPTVAGEICDGDIVRMWGAHEGEMIGPWLMIVALDVAHLRAMGFRYRTRSDGATCIPTLTDGKRHLVEACGNPAEVVEEDSITAAVIREYMRGGSSPAGPRTWEGASAHVALPTVPAIWHVPGGSVPPVEPGNPPAPPIPAVPLPASAWLFLAALASLLSMRGLRR